MRRSFHGSISNSFRELLRTLTAAAIAFGLTATSAHAELSESPPEQSAGLGTKLTSDGTSFLLASAPYAFNGGRVQVFRANPTAAWSLFDTLQGSDTASNDHFGLGLAANKGLVGTDPYLVAVGAPRHSQGRGAVYVFEVAGLEFTQVAKIMSPNPEAGAEFGSFVAFSPDGRTLAVTARRDRTGCPACDPGNGQGNVYVFKRHPKTGWTFSADLSSSLPISTIFEGLGTALAFVPGLSPTETPELLVGSPGTISNNFRMGAVYVLREFTPGTWTLTQTIAAPAEAGIFQGFGNSLSLTPNGANLCVGAPTTSYIGPNPPAEVTIGAAHVLNRVSGVWSNMTRLPALGSTVLIRMGEDIQFVNNQILAVRTSDSTVTLYRGAIPYEVLRDPTYIQNPSTFRAMFSLAAVNETLACGVPIGASSGVMNGGSVLLFDAGVGKFGAADPAPLANFGAAVAAFNQIAVIGQPGANPGTLAGHDTGLVEFFQRSTTGGIWARIASVPSPLPTTAPATPFHRFGAALAYPVANRVVVGAPEWSASSGGVVLDRCGAVALLVGNSTGTVWNQGGALPYPLSSPPQSGELVGSAIAAVKSGNFLFIAAGAPNFANVGPQNGRVHIWRGPIGGSPAQFVRLQTLQAETAQIGARFGAALAMEAYSDGSIDLCIGAPGEDVPGPLPFSFISDVGSIYVYRKSALSSAFVATINAARHPNLSQGSQYGSALSLKSGKLAVGAPFANNGSVVESGRVYGWSRVAGLWSQLANPFPGTLPGGRLGAAVATNGSSVLVGEPGANLNGLLPNAGRVRTLSFTSTGFSGGTTTIYADARPADAFGSAVAFGNGTGSLPSVIGSPSNDTGDINSSGMAFGFSTPLDPCVADVDVDFAVGPTDLALVIAEWGPQELGRSSADINDDGHVDAIDLAMVLTYWESCSDE